MKSLTFFKPDLVTFPCLRIARKVAQSGGSGGAVMNAANEIAVHAFLEGKIPFVHIPEIIRRVLKKHIRIAAPTLDEIFACDTWARKEAELLCCQQ